MFERREYEDFTICRPAQALPFSLTRRRLVQAAPALVLAGASGPVVAATDWTKAIDAAIGVITNVDALAGKIWPKVEQFFQGSQVSAHTIAHVANAAGNELSNSGVHAVSIAQNRTPMVQSGTIQHSFDQEFSQAFIDMCLCNIHVNEVEAAYWRSLATQAQQAGRYDVAQIETERAQKAQGDAEMYKRKLNTAVFDAPVQITLPPDKPVLTTVTAPPAVTDVLDKGDFFLAHATARQRTASSLASV